MTFLQIIEYTTSEPDEIDELISTWIAASQGRRTASRAVAGRDRDRSGSYMQIVEFPSHEAAMANDALPETGDFGRRLMELCDVEPTFHNLDVVRDDVL